MRILLTLIFAGSLWAAGPVPIESSITTKAMSANSIQACWITDIAGNSIIKFGPNGGPYTTEVLTRSDEENAITHCMVAGGRAPSTQYFFVVCSSDGSENCSSQQTVTTPANPSVANQLPAAAAAVDISWTAGTGTPHTATVNCRSLQTIIDAGGTVTNDKIIIPVALSPGCVPFLRIPATKTNILITTDSTNRPPTGVRDDCTIWTCTTVYRSYRDMRNGPLANVQALTGKPVSAGNVWCNGGQTNLDCWPPGSRVYARVDQTWLIKKASLDGDVRTITNVTLATPMVVTYTGTAFANDEIICVKGAQVEARGCWVVAGISGNTLQLKKRDSSNSVGYNAYPGGGEAQGLIWADESHAIDSATPLDGVACVTPGSWGRGRTAPGGDADHEQYMCGTDLVWYKVDNDNTQVSNSDGAFQLAAFNLAPGGSKIRFEGLICADPPVPILEEYKYGPLNGTPGARTGGCYFGGKGSDRVDLNQVSTRTDMAFQRPFYTTGDTLVAGQTSNFVWRNSGGVKCGGVGIAYIDLESECSVIGLTDTPGPVGFWNNDCEAGGWCVFYPESSQMVVASGWTILGNTIRSNCGYSYGTSTYSYANGLYAPLRNWYRQLLEWKTGTGIRVDGNTFDCLPVSAGTPVAIEPGSQSGKIDFLAPTGILSNGTMALNPQSPNPAMTANDRVMIYDSVGGSESAFIARISTVSPFVLKNLDGTAYSHGAYTTASMCQLDQPWAVRDITITNNYFTRVAAPWFVFGMSYQGANICMAGPAGPVLVQNNLAYTSSLPQAAPALSSTGANQAPHWLAGIVDYATIQFNTSINADSSSSINESGFVSSFTPANFLNYGLFVYRNLMGSQDAAILGEGNAGTAALNTRWIQGSNFTGDAFVRSGGDPGGQPAGNVYPTVAQVDYTSSGVPKYSSAYTAYGIDLASLTRARGLLSNPRLSVDSNSVIVKFTSPVAGQHWYAEISTDDATWTRATSTGSGYEQVADVTASAATTYSTRMIGPTGVTNLGKIRTP